MNYFEWFGLEVSFEIDQKLLKQKYFQLSRQHHPDLQNDTNSFDASSYNNEAFKTLKKDIARYQYIFNLLSGLKLKDQVSQTFLFEMMEINEKIEEWESSQNSKIPSELLHELDVQKRDIMNELHQYFQLDPRSLEEKQWSKIARILNKQKYIQRIEARIRG